GLGHEWGLVGAGVRAADQAVRPQLLAQGRLTTRVEQEADAASARLTPPIVDDLPPRASPARATRLPAPALRIVSPTIPEAGDYTAPASQRFDPRHPDMVRDAHNCTTPQTVFGLILAGLKRRRDVGIMPFTVMSCDNIPGNGAVTRNAV